MPRLMSVALTEDAVRARTKTVTRRLGWKFLTPGDRLTLCRKVMGRKKDEPLMRIADVVVTDARREPLYMMSESDCAREGFPDWDVTQFLTFFCEEMGVDSQTLVTRIEWRYLDDTAYEEAG